MSFLMPSKRAAAIALALMLLPFAGRAADGEALGYWTCKDAVWTAVGAPSYPQPSKPCGLKVKHHQTELACTQAGGEWRAGGIMHKPMCFTPTGDGGRTCGDTGECEGTCVAELSWEKSQELFGKTPQRTHPALGTCTSRMPVFGCIAFVNAGSISGLICLD